VVVWVFDVAGNLKNLPPSGLTSTKPNFKNMEGPSFGWLNEF